MRALLSALPFLALKTDTWNICHDWLLKFMQVRTVLPGHNLARRGDAANSLWILQSGENAVFLLSWRRTGAPLEAWERLERGRADGVRIASSWTGKT